MILVIKTAGMEAMIALFDSSKKSIQKDWEPGRKLSQELLPAIQNLLAEAKCTLSDVAGIVVFRGPGSFTSLRIGITTANTLAFALQIPVVGSMEDDWVESGLQAVQAAEAGSLVRPEYGSEPNITQPKK